MAVINIDDAYILNETGEQVDKVTGLFTKDENTTNPEKAFAQLNIGTAGSNRNLLDNPWFTVNQRGLTSGTHTTMPADRWKATYGSGSVNWTRESDGCITFAPTNTASHGDIYQQIPDEIYNALAGTDKTVTLSVMMQDGTIYSGTSYLPATNTRAYIDVRNVGGTSSRLVVYVQASTKQLFVQAFYGSLTVKAVKLEKGSVSTLENDAPPDYGEELLKCQRYFTRWYSTAGSSAIGLALAVGTTNANFALLSNLRAEGSATVSFTGLVLSDGTDKTVTNVSVAGAGDGKSMRLLVTSSGLTAYRPYVLQITAGGHLDVSKDL